MIGIISTRYKLVFKLIKNQIIKLTSIEMFLFILDYN